MSFIVVVKYHPLANVCNNVRGDCVVPMVRFN
jgi:hypothetical protein